VRTYALEPSVALVSPERDTGRQLAVELVAAHVRVVPAVRRDHPAVGLGGVVDDLEDRMAVVVTAAADAHTM
jgi:hypothetical protein